MPTTCAIILDYFGSSKTIACLTSLADQGLDTVMIVDNSGDSQANIQLQEALTDFRQSNKPFTIHQIVNSKNLGYAAGVNIALRWLKKNQPHRYYLLINNDAQATPGMLTKLLQFMQEHDRTALTAPIIDMGQKEIAYSWYHRFTGLMFSHHIIGTFPYLTGCCLLVDQRIVGDALFDEDFFMYGEDVELCWRLRLSGWETACISQALVLHEGTGSSHHGGFFYEYHVARGHLLLAGKLAKHRCEIPFLYSWKLLILSARALLRSIRFRSLVPIKAWISALQKNHISMAR